MWNLKLCLVFGALLQHSTFSQCASIPESLQDFQMDYYLPYSNSEDVDFSISRPEGFGCYKWSIDDKYTDLVRLETHVTNHELNCGNKLLFKVLSQDAFTARWGERTVNVVITGENVKTETKSNRDTKTKSKSETGAPSIVKYTIHVREVTKLDVLALNTDLTAGSDLQPFAVVGYDKDGNEFDTLDGLQVSWFLGAKRNIAEFEHFSGRGPVTKLRPIGVGTGSVIALLTDANYKNLAPGVREISVKAQLEFEPDNLVLLQHGKAPVKVFEWMALENGTYSRRQVFVGKGDKDEFELEVSDPEIIRIDGFASGGCQITALKEGSTEILLKNRNDGEIWKRHHVTVATAAYSNIKASNPRHTRVNQRQLTKNDEYDLEVELFTKHNFKIFPSENILSLLDASDSLYGLEFEKSRLLSKVRVEGKGFMNVSNTLKSITGDNEKEYEIIPHVTSKTVFEAWDPVNFQPEEFILPWDENVKPIYFLVYRVEGGDDTYAFNISRPELATSDQLSVDQTTTANNVKMRDSTHETIIKTHSGPGTFEVTAYMPKNPEDNQDNATVHILPVSRIDFNPLENVVEFPTGTDIGLTLKMTTEVNCNETAMFSSCHEVPYEILLSDEDNFKGVKKTGRTVLYASEGRKTMAHERYKFERSQKCTDFTIKQLSQKPGLLAEVGIKYQEPLTGQVLRARKVISTFDQLSVLHPKPKESRTGKLVLPVGSSSDIVMKGGPLPWKKLFGRNDVEHFQNVSIDGEEYDKSNVKLLKVIRNNIASQDNVEANLVDDEETINDLHVYSITCLEEGSGIFKLSVGNHDDPNDDLLPMTSSTEVEVVCSLPSKISIVTAGDEVVHDSKGNVFADNTKGIRILLTVKDKNGNTFENIQSLQFDRKFSDESLVDQTKSKVDFVVPQTQFHEHGSITLPGKPYQTLFLTGKEGVLGVTVKLSGYDQTELSRHEIKTPPTLPKVVDDEEDYDDEEEEEYVEHNHDLVKYLSVKLVSPMKIKSLKTK